MADALSIFKTSERYKRRRTPQACFPCRKRKTKCDGIQPLCRTCRRLRDHCQWPDYGNYEATVANIDTGKPSLEQNRVLYDLFFSVPHLEILRLSIHKPTFNTTEDGGQSPFLKSAIFSLAALYLKDNAGLELFDGESPTQISERFAVVAHQLAKDTSDQPSVKHIQANLILAYREIVSRSGYKAWMYTGFAIRMAQMLRLGKEYHYKHPPVEREVRRRCMWSCFVMDYFISQIMCRPPAIQSKDVSIQLPCPESAFMFGEDYPTYDLRRFSEIHPPHQDVLPYFLEVLDIWRPLSEQLSAWVRGDVFSAEEEFFDPLLLRLRNWIPNLPNRMLWSEQNYRAFQLLGQGNIFVSFHMILNHAFCMARQAYLPHVTVNGDGTPVTLSSHQLAAIEHCLHYANEITKISTTLFQGNDTDRASLWSHFTGIAMMCAVAIQIWSVHSLERVSNSSCMSIAAIVDYQYPEAKIKLLIEIMESWHSSWSLSEAWRETINFLEELYNIAYGKASIDLEDSSQGVVDLEKYTALGSGVCEPQGGRPMLSRWTQALIIEQSETSLVKRQHAWSQMQTLCRHMLLQSQMPAFDVRLGEEEPTFDLDAYLDAFGMTTSRGDEEIAAGI